MRNKFILSLILVVLCASLVSAGWFSFLDKIWNPAPVVPVYPSSSLSNNAGLASAEGKFCNHDWDCDSGYCTESGDAPGCTRNSDDSKRKCKTVDLVVPVSLEFHFPDGRQTWTWDEVPIKSGETVLITDNNRLQCPPCIAQIEDWAVTGWYLDGAKIGTSLLTSDMYGCKTQFTYTFNVAPGTHTLKFVLDDKNDLKENYEDNNVIVRKLIVSGCTPTCINKKCGDSDGCNGKCTVQTCSSGQTCQAGQCVSSSCTPTCVNKKCGDSDGCNGICNVQTCSSGQTCQKGQCVSAIIPTSGCHARGGTCPADNDGRPSKSTCPKGKVKVNGAPDCAYCCVPGELIDKKNPPKLPYECGLLNQTCCPGRDIGIDGKGCRSSDTACSSGVCSAVKVVEAEWTTRCILNGGKWIYSVGNYNCVGGNSNTETMGDFKCCVAPSISGSVDYRRSAAVVRQIYGSTNFYSNSTKLTPCPEHVRREAQIMVDRGGADSNTARSTLGDAYRTNKDLYKSQSVESGGCSASPPPPDSPPPSSSCRGVCHQWSCKQNGGSAAGSCSAGWKCCVN
ncbi:MAG: hypothetical protein AABX70_01180 [Nanoarchaeota archaeon]